MKAGLIVLLASLVTAGLLSATPVRADATITSSTVTNGFPRNIVFNVQASADVDIVDLTLSYNQIFQADQSGPSVFGPINNQIATYSLAVAVTVRYGN